MKTEVRVALILLPVVMFWACQTEEVADLSKDVKTTEVIARLAASSSQAETEAAVRSLIVKAEMGETFPGSRYESYTFSDEDIAELAELDMLYSSGELKPSLGDAFDAVMRVADGISLPEMGFETVVDILQGQTAHALAEPEEPENALLVAIAAEDGRIPTSAPSYNQNTVRSPVQAALFALWLHREFAEYSGTSANLAPADADDDAYRCYCIIKCYKGYIRRVLRCYSHFPPGLARDKCLGRAEERLRECLEDCHDQGGTTDR